MYALVSELYPICRSITGDGVRDTLRRIGTHVPLEISEVPSGTQVFDWTIPREWNIRDAFIKNSRGERIVDFKRSNLHVLNYSTPVHARLSLQELRPHLFSIEQHPTWIPYRTSYYAENWGFCVSHDQLQSLTDDEYEVCIDSSLSDGSLTYGEYYLPGETTDEVLVSCHVCHPSLCNDNLSGISVATFLASEVARRPRRYWYRFLFIPGTIGAITWLARNKDRASRIQHGLVLTCVGDPGGFHYKRSRQGHAEIDRVVEHVLRHEGVSHEVLDFSPYGYDERQYCSPGFNLAVGCLMRSVSGQFPEYQHVRGQPGPCNCCCARRNASDVHEHRRGARAQPDIREHESLLRAGSGETWAVSNRWRERRQRQYGAPVGPQPVGRRTLTARHRRTLGAGFCNGTCRGY